MNGAIIFGSAGWCYLSCKENTTPLAGKRLKANDEMRKITPVVIAAAAIFVSGCTDRMVRSVVINEGHIHPHQITVPANTPFHLTAAAIGPSATSISGPEIGMPSLDVPATWVTTISPRGSSLPGDLRKARIDLGPLEAGTYQITCDCGGRNQTINLIVE